MNKEELLVILSTKTKQELIGMIDAIKTSDYPIDIKDFLLKEIDYKLGNIIVRDDVLKDIKESKADIDDMKD